MTEPNPKLNGRSLRYSMGKVLGGGSSINVSTWSLEISNADDARQLQAFGTRYELADHDRRLVFFASTRYLFVVQDNRMTTIDFVTN